MQKEKNIVKNGVNETGDIDGNSVAFDSLRYSGPALTC